MAKKSKTQKAKASAARQQRKAERELEAQNPQATQAVADEPEKKGLFKKSADAAPASSDSGKAAKKADEKPKKKRFQFFRDVKAEMKRVTWPTRSGVFLVALLFFGIFVAVLDNAIITPLLVLVSGIGA